MIGSGAGWVVNGQVFRREMPIDPGRMGDAVSSKSAIGRRAPREDHGATP